MFKTCKKPPMSIISASGDVCSFKSLQSGLPLKSHKIDVSPTLNGVSEINIGMVNWNQIATINEQFPQGGISATIDANGIISLSGTSTGTYANIFKRETFVVGHKYLFYKEIIENPNNVSFSVKALNVNLTPTITGSTDTKHYICNANVVNGTYIGIANYSSDVLFDGIKLRVMIIDLTSCFNSTTIADYIYSLEQQTAGAGVALFKQIFYKNYYAYNAGGVLVSAASVNGDTYPPYATVQIGQTVYGGEYDARTGVLTVTHGFVDMGALEYVYSSFGGINYFRSLSTVNANYANEDYICEVLKSVTYSQGVYGLNSDNTFFINSNLFIYLRDDSYTDATALKTAYNGKKIVYELATPTTIQLPPCPIDTLQGVNNIWADCGATSIEAIKIGR